MNVQRLVSDCKLDGARVYDCEFHVVLCMCVEYYGEIGKQFIHVHDNY